MAISTTAPPEGRRSRAQTVRSGSSGYVGDLDQRVGQPTVTPEGTPHPQPHADLDVISCGVVVDDGGDAAATWKYTTTASVAAARSARLASFCQAAGKSALACAMKARDCRSAAAAFTST